MFLKKKLDKYKNIKPAYDGLTEYASKKKKLLLFFLIKINIIRMKQDQYHFGLKSLMLKKIFQIKL